MKKLLKKSQKNYRFLIHLYLMQPLTNQIISLFTDGYTHCLTIKQICAKEQQLKALRLWNNVVYICQETICQVKGVLHLPLAKDLPQLIKQHQKFDFLTCIILINNLAINLNSNFLLLLLLVIFSNLKGIQKYIQIYKNYLEMLQ